MIFFKSNTSHVRAIALHLLTSIALLSLASCSGSVDKPNERANVYNLNVGIKDKGIPNRTIIDYEITDTLEIKNGNNYSLLHPQSLTINSEGNRIYIYDYGDMKVKKFDKDGKYLQSYGNGVGDAPGKVKNIANAGPIGDSIVYIADQRRRRINFFRRDGSLSETKSFEDLLPYRYGINTHGSEYIVTLGFDDKFININRGNSTKTFGKFHNGEVILSDGEVKSYKNKIIYIPSFYPVLIEYGMEDTAGTAYPTPDYGNEDAPSANVRVENGTKRVGAPPTSERVHVSTALVDDTLSVQIPCPKSGFKTTTCFDLYEAKDLTYIETIKTPIDKGSANYWRNTVVSEKDTVVLIHEIRSNTDG